MNILITGASRGIGFETARILARDHRVLNISRRQAPDSGIRTICFDLGTGNIEQELVPQIKKEFSGVDILINNAAGLIRKPFSELTLSDWEYIYRTNVFSIALLTRAVLPMMKRGGHVVNISSVGGVQGSTKFPGLTAYSSTKGALITLTEVLAEEYKQTGIAFNAIAFGSVQTEMLSEAFPGYKAPVTAEQAGIFLAEFALNGNKKNNGRIIPFTFSTP